MASIFISHSSRDQALAARVKRWLDSQGFQRVFLDFDKEQGLGVGEDWERRLYEEISRCHAVVVLVTEAWLKSKWCFAELTQARAQGKLVFPIVDPPGDASLIGPEISDIQFEAWTEAGREHLARRLRSVTDEVARGHVWDGSRPPYPGILSFEAEDAAVFFGRDEEIREVCERLEARRIQGGARLLMIAGASGSGKSSLMKAGVLPYLARDRANWVVVPPFRPERDPLAGLAKSLVQALGNGGDWHALRDRLEAGPDALGALAEELRVGPSRSATVLIAVDQFEELFIRSDPAARSAMLSLLAGLAELPVLAVATVRSDMLGEILRAEDMTLQFADYPLRPVQLDAVPAIVEGPASVAAIAMEEGLALRIARDAATTDALPLVAFALRELYDRHGRARRITKEDYVALGDPAAGLSPLENAIRRKAEQTVADAAAGTAARNALRECFVGGLARISDDGRFLRRPARLADLPQAAHPAIDSLVNARLLTARAEDGERVVEVAHEALFAAWPELAGWLEEERAFLNGLRRIEDAARSWERLPEAERPAALLHGLLLAEARQWRAEHPDRLGEVRAFVDASIAHDDALAARAARRRRITVAASLAVAAVCAGLALLAWRAEQHALAEAERAERNFAAAVTAVDGLIDDIADGLRDVEGIRTEAVARVLDGVGSTIETLSQETSDPAVLDPQRSAMLDEFAITYLKVGDVARALDAAGRSQEIARRLADAAPDDADAVWNLASRLDTLGDARLAAGDTDGARLAYDESLALRRALMGKHAGQPDYVWGVGLSLVRIGDLLDRTGDAAGAREAYEQSLELRRDLADAHPDVIRYRRDVALMLARLGDVAYRNGDLTEAERRREEALALRREVAEAEPEITEWQRDLGVELVALGDIRRRRGDGRGAIEAYQDALEIRRRLARLDPSNAQWQGDVGAALERLGDAYWLIGELEAASAAYEANIAVWRALSETAPENTAWQRNLGLALIRVGDVAVQRGRAGDAATHHGEALAIYRRLVALDPRNSLWQRDLTVALNRQAAVLLRGGDAAGAVTLLEESLGMRRALADEAPGNLVAQQDIAVVLTRLAEARVEAGATHDAEAAYTECAAISQALVDVDAAVAGWAGDLAECLIGLAGVVAEAERGPILARAIVAIDAYGAHGSLPARLVELRAEAERMRGE